MKRLRKWKDSASLNAEKNNKGGARQVSQGRIFCTFEVMAEKDYSQIGSHYVLVQSKASADVGSCDPNPCTG